MLLAYYPLKQELERESSAGTFNLICHDLLGEVVFLLLDALADLETHE